MARCFSPFIVFALCAIAVFAQSAANYDSTSNKPQKAAALFNLWSRAMSSLFGVSGYTNDFLLRQTICNPKW